MNLFKIISHPYTLVIAYLMLLISGEHLGGFYLLYILLALPYGGLHSILAVGGIVLILFSHHNYKNIVTSNFGKIINIIGLSMLFISIYYFFWNDPKNYNIGTFYQTLPLTSFIITGFIALCFLINNLPFISGKSKNSNLLSA